MTLLKPKAVLFDWDDTVVDTWDSVSEAINVALVKMGEAPWSSEEAHKRRGPSARDLFTEIFGDRWEEADRFFYQALQEIFLKNVRIFPHVEDILKTLKDNNVYLAVVSNKRGPLLRSEVEHVQFGQYFSKIVGAGDAEEDKPTVAPVHLALGESGIKPGPDVWFIGDSHTDMLCAANAGCSSVLLETQIPPEALLAESPPTKRFQGHVDFMEFTKACFS